ncbi:MAG: hypothetical protein CVT63_03360 [Candidatus Anoxymicrobium japonicum]|uniref:Uncharacterized protein n=1 Tax=Candidatus Anoxymicrobium japonicum TaxID=2013648 RepID=A0A2N3G6H2_9ACTN|nr:MAG: hypothetical protein CVT63_03360 [Candidatus Anoxymicrobium japonicum]
MNGTHKWKFKQRFRRGAYGWRGTSLASKRLREAVSEIKKVAKKEPVLAADGIVSLFERIWPALEGIDSSSGALGVAVDRSIDALLPIFIEAPADIDTRRRWLERLYNAVCDDGVDFLSPVKCSWGEACAFPELVAEWLDFLLPGLVDHLKDRRPMSFFMGEAICLSCLFEAGRYEELRELLSKRGYSYWPYDRFWAEALLRMGRTDEAVAYAGSRHPDEYESQSILEFCERALLEDGRRDEAYWEYGLGIRSGNTYLANYRAIVKKYPEQDPEQVLRDLIDTSQERGKWFAAARQAGFFDVARQCARSGLVEPKTLVTAARDGFEKDPSFSFEVALRALDLMLQGYGYELAVIDILPAFEILFRAADAKGVEDWAMASVMELLSREVPRNDPACADYLRVLMERRQREHREVE